MPNDHFNSKVYKDILQEKAPSLQWHNAVKQKSGEMLNDSSF